MINDNESNSITPLPIQPLSERIHTGCEGCRQGQCHNCEWGDDRLRGIAACGCGRSDHQLHSFDYLADIPGNKDATDFVEVQFKNTRKGFFRNDNHLDLKKGDIVAVEALPGHDIGVVTLTGKLVILQMQKANLKQGAEVRRVYRKARQTDIEKYEEAKSREHATMIRSRQIAKDLNLQMKIGDVEYQGDGNKAIFYYIADQRVDFRKLIKVLAETFRVRIEMKQIGARQEAGRIGGIGPCGRELCCATWMKNFNSVSTAAARFQDITPNPQKLAGQCAKLKCCLNYEVDTYMEATRSLPEKNVQLETQDGTYYYFKADILARTIAYSTDRNIPANLETISAERAWEIIRMNAKGQRPLSLRTEDNEVPKGPVDLAEQDDLTRFDKVKKKGGKGCRKGNRGGSGEDRNPNANRREGRERRPDNTAQQTAPRNGNGPAAGGGNREGRKRRPERNHPEGHRNPRRNDRPGTPENTKTKP